MDPTPTRLPHLHATMHRAIRALLTPFPDGVPSLAGQNGALLPTLQVVTAAESFSSHSDGSGSTAAVAVVHDVVVHAAAVKADEAHLREDELEEDAHRRMTFAWSEVLTATFWHEKSSCIHETLINILGLSFQLESCSVS